MMLDDKLGMVDQVELAKAEEKISKRKAKSCSTRGLLTRLK
jgi:hypothetical protein